MFFPKLMNLSGSFSIEQLSTFDRYMAALSPAAQDLITAEKLCCATGVEYLECKHFWTKLPTLTYFKNAMHFVVLIATRY